MKDFIFFAVIYGAAASLTILSVGSPWRLIGTFIDQKLFPARWVVGIPSNQRGGAIRIFVHCPACVSFWIGALFSWILYSPARTYFEISRIPALAVDGLASAGIIWFIHVVLTRLGQYEL
jgi:hypothetical protein